MVTTALEILKGVQGC